MIRPVFPSPSLANRASRAIARPGWRANPTPRILPGPRASSLMPKENPAYRMTTPWILSAKPVSSAAEASVAPPVIESSSPEPAHINSPIRTSGPRGHSMTTTKCLDLLVNGRGTYILIFASPTKVVKETAAQRRLSRSHGHQSGGELIMPTRFRRFISGLCTLLLGCGARTAGQLDSSQRDPAPTTTPTHPYVPYVLSSADAQCLNTELKCCSREECAPTAVHCVGPGDPIDTTTFRFACLSVQSITATPCECPMIYEIQGACVDDVCWRWGMQCALPFTNASDPRLVCYENGYEDGNYFACMPPCQYYSAPDGWIR